MKSKEIVLKISEAFQQDVGYGRARIDNQTRIDLDLSIGDVIEIEGTKKTAAVVWRAHPTDEGKGLIRIDNLTRKNAGSGLGDRVTVRKAEVKEANEAVLAPLISKGQQIQFGSGIGTLIKKGLLKRPLAKGDSVIIPGIALFGSSLPFVIINTSPGGIVSIGEDTLITVKEEAAKEIEMEGPRVSYEDIGGLHNEILKVREMIELPLKHPELFDRLGIDPPKGVLLHGPPGTGKTLIAKAVANESGANFYTINGPEIMCVDGETKIFTNPSGSVKAKEVFCKKGKKYGDNKITTVELEKPLSTYAFKDGKITKAKITHVTKLSAPTYKIKFSDGNEIKASNNQPFLVYDNGDFIWKRVSDLKKGEYIARINKIATEEKSYQINPNKIKNLVKIDDGYTIKSRNISRSNIVKLPKASSDELMEFIGLLVSDGNISKKGDCITFANNSEDLKVRFKVLLRYLFDITKTREYDDGRIVVYSTTLVRFLEHIGFKYGNKLNIPGYFYKLTKQEIMAFIRGYFDGDGTVAMTGNYPTPKLFSSSKEFIQELQSLLQIKLEISSRIGLHKTPKGDIYELVIRGYEGRLKFLDIGSSIIAKMKRLEKINDVKRIKDFHDVPSPSLLIKEIKAKLPYETYRNKDYYIYGAGNITKHALSTLYQLAEKEGIVNDTLKKEFQLLNRDDIGWEKVESKKFLGEQELYDFTVNKDSFIGGSYFFLHNSKFYGQSEENLRKIFEEAEKNAPSIIFIDEIDAIAPKRSEVHGEVERRVVSQLLTLMDGLKGRGKLIVIGATNIPDTLDPALRRPGRFDREIRIDAPDRNGRKEILQIHTRGMPMAKDCNLDDLADITYGYVGADLAALARESAMNALRRYLPEIDLENPIPTEILEKMEVTMDDFKNAHRGIEPSAMREFLIEIPKVSWNDIGGLEDIKQQLREAVEWPLTKPEVFKRMGITPPRGILLYGPPGTGKTLLAKAVASESKANFISIKGPEVMSKWVGESEKAVRELFKKARQVAPTIVFLDELDAIAPMRGTDTGTHVHDSVVNQLLTSIDGLESMEGVVVIGATNRPDIIDVGLLRPGRFDRLVLIHSPDEKARLEIFKIHTKEIPIDITKEELKEIEQDLKALKIEALTEKEKTIQIGTEGQELFQDDVDKFDKKDAKKGDLKKLSGKEKLLYWLAVKTDNYSGADIESLCREAAMLAIRIDEKAKIVTKKHFDKAMETVRASITPNIKKFYEKVSETLGSGIAKKDKSEKDIQYM
jgi:SpoVK/Ycf46/Vps4 family AAA+-type ATPase